MEYCGFDSEFSHDPRRLKRGEIYSLQFAGDGEHYVKDRGGLHDIAAELPPHWYSFNLLVELGALELLGYERGKHFNVYTYGSQYRSTFRPARGLKFKLYDVASICRQLGLWNVEKVGEFLTKQGMPFPKLPDADACTGCPHYPCGKTTTRWKCEKYAMQDALIVREFVRLMESRFGLDFTKIGSTGTIAAQYLRFPNRLERVGGRTFAPIEEKFVRHSLFAGRNECFRNGFLGHTYYNDVKSLYPTATLLAGSLDIVGVTESGMDALEISTRLDNREFGWVQGLFEVGDNGWGLPYRKNGRNYYIRDSTVNGIYSTLDLAAAGAKIKKAFKCWAPVWGHTGMEGRYAELYWKKNGRQFRDEVEERFYKAILNSATGKIGQGASKSFISSSTNFPAYSSILGMSHLIMSNILRESRCDCYGMDTDSIFSDDDLSGEWDSVNGIPVIMDVKNSGELAYLRSKLYHWMGGRSKIHAWKMRYEEFGEMVEQAYHRETEDRKMHINMRVTPKVRTLELKRLPLGMWYYPEVWVDKHKQIRLCLADIKRERANYDSLGLVESGGFCTSRPWTAEGIPEQVHIVREGGKEWISREEIKRRARMNAWVGREKDREIRGFIKSDLFDNHEHDRTLTKREQFAEAKRKYLDGEL